VFKKFAHPYISVRGLRLCTYILTGIPFVAFSLNPRTDVVKSLMTNHQAAPHADSPSQEPSPASSFTATAAALTVPLDASGFPLPAAWQSTAPIRFDADWRGENADPQRGTEVRLLWTPSTLYLKFVCRFRTITVFGDADPNGRRDKLWDRDVAEVFLQPAPSRLHRYKEFEVSPNGFWIDLDIDNGERQDLRSAMQRGVSIDQAANSWTAELAIPLASLLQHFDPQATWRVNFYRVEGPTEPRFYAAWSPTLTPQPNFHAPEHFGYLKFAPAPSAKP
jgi:hypothetical protein